MPCVLCMLLASQWGGMTYPWSDGRISCAPRALQPAPHRLRRRPVLDGRGRNSASTYRAAAQRRQRGHLHRLRRHRILHHGVLSTHLVPGNKGCLRYRIRNRHPAHDNPDHRREYYRWRVCLRHRLLHVHDVGAASHRFHRRRANDDLVSTSRRASVSGTGSCSVSASGWGCGKAWWPRRRRCLSRTLPWAPRFRSLHRCLATACSSVWPRMCLVLTLLGGLIVLTTWEWYPKLSSMPGLLYWMGLW